jgi:3D (Asp-Asp-Asp) domain-containing protein
VDPTVILVGLVALVFVLRVMKQSDEASSDPVTPTLGSESLSLYLTSYWPFQAGLSSIATLMEGGHNDRKGHPLHTLEDHKSGDAPFVSLAGDYHIFPYGQRLIVEGLGTRDDGSPVIARVVDTGGHFYGPNKVIRLPGHEPIDVCVASSSSASKFGFGGPASAQVVEGDVL